MAAATNNGGPRRKQGILRRTMVGALTVFVAVLLLPFLVFVLLIRLFAIFLLYILVWLTWNTRGKDVLLVYSNSPIWREYMEHQVISPLQHRAVILNWSERKKWRRLSLGFWVFQYFGGSTEFNPMALVFRPLRRVEKFRYWEPFKLYQRGDIHWVEAQTAALFSRVGESAPGRSSPSNDNRDPEGGNSSLRSE